MSEGAEPGCRREGKARGDDDDRRLEQWHESNLGNISYLAIFAIVSIITVVAFVPVWVLLQIQRAAGQLGPSVRSFTSFSRTRPEGRRRV
jgi:hypothetical protein